MMGKPIVILFGFLCSALSLSAIAQPDNTIATGYIRDVAVKRDISAEDLVKALLQADVVLIGEQHNITAHHSVEQWLLQQSANQGREGSVLLEMLDSTQQSQVTRVQQWLLGGGNTSQRLLADKMKWNHAWNWGSYGAIMHTIMHQPAKVLAANPSRKALKAAGNFKPQGPMSSAPEVGQDLAKIISGNHGSATSMVSAQQYKDYTMANSILSAPKPAWLIAGAIHSSKQLGVPLFLQDAHYMGQVKVLILTDPDSDIADSHADYIWYIK